MSDDEEEYKPRLKPVMPQAPELHTLLDENGRPRRPTRASRRMKFLGLREFTAPLGSDGDGDDTYDMALGPSSPRPRRPLESEWSEGIMSDEDAQTIKKVSTARKKINPNQKSLSKKRGRPKKSE
jgi:hypothetical protein